ncbi:J domain-containing protein [Xanthomonas cucurbitae]|uniref:J domain-containing protein n=1 Tax=Xanthomonas cucurbitae TaxID=56453 RepID=A0A2S7DPT1_9XANT|nr:J domain-containing protein [Xanthomonas cucurbitae]PPU75838.1 molecular chaperone DnaJ [Xanthomonas cucurbitae]QHG87547.1 J domain-containing protein [Xanthomonas cucurbitae]WDM66413.1 J domain-containing protein [Xanthomonas cucurbitae]WDM70291.1 J domain-containing protein [Xanthomonas cucurbitae]WDM74158.1 J domain-containing protein [Xanthomonas cucurbitae]
MPKTTAASPSNAPVSTALQQLSRQPGDAGGQEMSPARKRFDRLLRDLQRHRTDLHDWREAVEQWRARYQAEVLPLFEQQRVLEIEQIHLLDRIDATVKLSRIDRDFVSDEICDLAGPLIEIGHVELKPIYERHNEVGYDDELDESDELMKQVIGQLYGLDPEELASVDSPDELFERVNARLDQAQAEADAAGEHARQPGAGERRRRPEKKTAKAKAQAEPPPLRELYRKLASNLHPDRASDADDRATRTELMQRLNAAYKGNDLLGLLELQAEIGLLDAQGVDAINPTRLKEYNRELDRQCKELKYQLAQHAMDFCYAYDLDLPAQPKPEGLDRLMTKFKRQVANEVLYRQALLREIRELTDTKAIKRWLKLQRDSVGFY